MLTTALVGLLALPLAAPPPSPSLCLILSEVFTRPDADVQGRQWVRVRNRCAQPVSAKGIVLRWSTGSRWDSGGVLALDQLDTIKPNSCVTVGGTTSDTANFNPSFDLGQAFSPSMAIADASLEGVGLFKAGAAAPFDAVFYGTGSDSDLLGEDGKFVAGPDLAQVDPARSMWRSGKSWFDNAPSPHSCLYGP